MFKLYKQRLFSTMYPSLIEIVKAGDDKIRAPVVKLIMHSCALVSIANLQDKLSELIPIAEEALKIRGSENQVIKLTAM